jgi:L-arabinose isomerase
MPEMNRARVGLLSVGHHYYWDQYPRLKAMGERMGRKLHDLIGHHADIISSELVDTPEKSRQTGRIFAAEDVDIVLVFPFGYTPSANVLPAVRDLTVPIRLLNAHEDRTYDYASADTTDYLHHEGVCSIPEFSGALVSIGKHFRVRTGAFEDARFLTELQSDFNGVAAARFFRGMNVGLAGQTYPGMTDMPIDEHRLIRATGRMLVRPEVEEFRKAYDRVTPAQLDDMYEQLRDLYEVGDTVTNEQMRFSAQVAVVYDEIIARRHDISAFGYYWWGEDELVTQLRAESSLAVSRLATMGRPGVTEGDVKSAMAMKILDLLGGGGMFVEFFAIDFKDDFLVLGHDGPTNISLADGKPRLTHLETQHGKSGHGIGIDFDMKEGPVTLLNLTQFDAGDTFKLIYSLGEIVSGDILRIGNPNARVRVDKPLHEFMDDWCQQGPSHHIALGIGDHTAALEVFAEAMRFETVRI